MKLFIAAPVLAAVTISIWLQHKPTPVSHSYNINKEGLSLRNPKICHNTRNELVCFNDGTYILHFKNNSFSGFNTVDSLVAYNDGEKKFTIKDLSSKSDQKNNGLAIRLAKNTVEFIRGDQAKIINAAAADSDFDWGNLKVHLSVSKGMDSVSFTAGFYHFILQVNTTDKNWKWTVREMHQSSLFYIDYTVDKNIGEIISHQDDDEKYGMAVATRYRNGNGIWYLQSQYVQTQESKGEVTIMPVKLEGGFQYYYTRSGNLIKERSKGEVKVCNCN